MATPRCPAEIWRNRAPSFGNHAEVRLPHRALQWKGMEKDNGAERPLTNGGLGRLRDQIAEGLVADGDASRRIRDHSSAPSAARSTERATPANPSDMNSGDFSANMSGQYRCESRSTPPAEATAGSPDLENLDRVRRRKKQQDIVVIPDNRRHDERCDERQ